MENKKIIFLNHPGDSFESGTPVGNGSMGAMFLGDPYHETVWLGEETIWSGEKRDTTVPEFKGRVDELRKMYLDGRLAEIDEKADETLTKGIERIRSCEYAGRIDVDFERKEEITNYSRKLNLTEGVAAVSYMNGSCFVTETAFSSYSYEVTALRWSFGMQSALDLYFTRENTDNVSYRDGCLITRCHTAYGGHKFCVGIRPVTDGEVSADADKGKLSIDGATFVTFYISICTEFNFGDNYVKTCREMLLDSEDYETILKGHISDFASLAGASDISLYSPAEIEAMPTDERIKRLREDAEAEDDGLFALYFAFGKYLMISSSRETTLPAHLQGVWVEKLENPWNADYHTNINLQMNYWLPEVANIPSCHLQLFDYMNKYLLDSGKHTAAVNYGCRGTVTHHLSDIYGFTTPADGLWGVWPMGGAWLSIHMWEHYLYTLDTDFLKNDAYEYMRQSALFLIDYMFEDAEGRLLTGPSTSPENRYYINDGDEKKVRYIAFSPTMDIEIVSEVLRNFISAESLLNLHPGERAQAEKALSKLPPFKTGRRGNLLEWLEDYEEPEPGHRHISHAFGLYPGTSISRAQPEIFEGIERTLDIRLSSGGGHTGWSRAWLISLFARLHNGEKCYENARALLTKSTLGNMLDSHPPFQIDGNFGGAAGIAESLVQSHEGFISILPAIKSNLTGSFTNLKARGNYTVSAEFKDGRLLDFSINFAQDSSRSFGNTVLVELPEDYVCDLPTENGLYKYTLK